jgi:L-ascorbate metabolism protein UlaG (beta-lactamase superfamily)
VIPQHYSTWPIIKQDPAAFKRSVESSTTSKVAVLKPSDRFEIR